MWRQKTLDQYPGRWRGHLAGAARGRRGASVLHLGLMIAIDRLQQRCGAGECTNHNRKTGYKTSTSMPVQPLLGNWKFTTGSKISCSNATPSRCLAFSQRADLPVQRKRSRLRQPRHSGRRRPHLPERKSYPRPRASRARSEVASAFRRVGHDNIRGRGGRIWRA